MATYRHREITLFHVECYGRKRAVLYWSGYGVVAPEIITSNGSPTLVARSVYRLMAEGAVVQPGTIDPNCIETEEQLRELLLETMNAYLEEDGYDIGNTVRRQKRRS